MIMIISLRVETEFLVGIWIYLSVQNLLDMSRITASTVPFPFSFTLFSSSVTHLTILKQVAFIRDKVQLAPLLCVSHMYTNAYDVYLSLMKLALAKHKAELTRMITMAGILMAIGY